MGLPHLQYQTLDATMLEAPVGTGNRIRRKGDKEEERMNHISPSGELLTDHEGEGCVTTE